MVIKDDNPQVFVCDNTGKLKHMFGRGTCNLHGLGICGQDEIMIPSDDFQIVERFRGRKSEVNNSTTRRSQGPWVGI